MRNKTFGFSLVEMLVVSVIMMIFITVSSLAYSQIRDQQDLKMAAKEVVATLYEAKQLAFYGKKPASCQNNNYNYNGNEIRLSSTTIYVYAVCNNSNNYYSIKTLRLKGGVRMSFAPNAHPFTFSTLNGETNLSAPKIIRLRSPNGRTSTITITQIGEIQ